MAQEVTDNVERSRYEFPVEGMLAFIDYRRSPGVVALTHAEVPPQLEGRGIGSRMVRAVLDAIRANGEKAIPHCSFVAAFVRRHPEYQDMIAR